MKGLNSFKSYLQVFPTKQQVWVSLEDQPMIADSPEWEKMFAGKEGIHFLDLEGRSRPHQGPNKQRRMLTRRKIVKDNFFKRATHIYTK